MAASPLPGFVQVARAISTSRAPRRWHHVLQQITRVDEPLIVTLSTDRKWIVASFIRATGNVWSNPELTCQHVDPQTSAALGQ